MTIELYDHEILEAEKVLKKLEVRRQAPVNREDFRKEIIGRFEEIGLVVHTKWYGEENAPKDEMIFPVVEIIDRCEPLKHGFDYEQQSYEVNKDILGIEPDKPKKIPFNPDELHK